MLAPIKLSSVAQSEPLVFNWPVNTQEKRNNQGADIIDIINFACNEYPIIKKYFDVNLLKISSIDKKNYEIILEISKQFNTSIYNLKNSTENLNDLLNKRASNDLIKYIMQYIYNKAVYDPDKLNQYEPFSPQVYGETSFDLIEEMLRRVNLSDNDIFIDLGSGVGNVVLQVAAMCNCKLSFGIEKADWPCKYAAAMENEFKLLMLWFGKIYSKFQLYNGDFLDDTDSSVNLKDMINEAKLIFVNNYAFGAEVDHQLKLRFSNMTEGAIIVSSKPFCSLNFRITSRNLNDIGAILNINEFTPINGHVSWTDKPINYYFHKIDRTILEKYFEGLKAKNKEEINENNPKKTTNKRNSSTTDDEEDEEYLDDDGDKSPSQKSRKKPKKLKRELSTSSTNKIPSTQNGPNNNNNSNITNPKKREKTKINVGATTTAVNTTKSEKRRNSNNSKTSPTNTTTKSIDQNVMNALNIMHNQAIKASLIVSTNCNTNECNNVDNNYNVKSMTKMRNTNIDCKLLKDCSIMDLDEFDLREQLGPEVSNAVDNYLKLCRKQILNYLLCMKLPQYVELIKQQIDKEYKMQNEIIKKTEQIEKQINSLTKSSVTLLKIRVSELGLKEIQTPKDLIDFATAILGNHQELLNKVNNLQQTVDGLKNQNENLSENTESECKNKKIVKEEVIENNEENTNRSPVSSLISYTKLFEPITPLKTESNYRSSTDDTLTASEEQDEENTQEFQNSKFKKICENKQLELFKDYPTYFNTSRSNDLLKSFKIPKHSKVNEKKNEIEDKFNKKSQSSPEKINYQTTRIESTSTVTNYENEYLSSARGYFYNGENNDRNEDDHNQIKNYYHFKKKKFVMDYQNSDSPPLHSQVSLSAQIAKSLSNKTRNYK